MSDNIPFDIQAEIIKNFPIKSMIRFRSVSKQWNSLIGSSMFVAEHHTHQKHKHHLIVSYHPFNYCKEKYVSILDDDTFPKHKVSLSVHKLGFRPKIVSSQGLLFLYRHDVFSRTTKGVIWNPTIRILVDIYMRDSYSASFGFCVCPHTFDPTIVKYKYNYLMHKREFEIFTLSTNTWRKLHNNLPGEDIELHSQVAIDRFMYWSAFKRIYEDDRYQSRELIVAFDMISEEFTEISFPTSLACQKSSLDLYNIRDSIVVVQCKNEAKKPVYSIWKMMEHGVSKSFTKLYTINTKYVIEKVHGFRKSGEPIVEMKNKSQKDLFAYELGSKHLKYIGIVGALDYYSVNSYIETLLLLDHHL